MIQKSLAQILKSLENVGKADDVYSVASSERLNAIQDAIRLLARGDNIVSGGGVHRTAGDGYVVLRSIARPRSSISNDFPWRITADGNDQEGWWVTVAPGTISNLLAINALDKIFISNDPETTWYIKLHCLTNGALPTVVTIMSDTIPVDNANNAMQNTPPPDFYVILGVVKALEVYQVIFTNLIGTADIAFLESRPPPSPGEEPYLRWWYWKVEAA